MKVETKIPVKDGAINLDEEVMCSILSERLRVRVWTPLRYTRDVKKENLLLLCQTWDTYSKNRGCVMHWYKNRRNSFPSQLGLSYNRRAIKGLVVCWVTKYKLM